MTLIDVPEETKKMLEGKIEIFSKSELMKIRSKKLISSSYIKKGNSGEEIMADEENILVPSGVWLTGAHLLWMQGFTGKDVKVAVLDTGIDSSHPDLKNVVVKHETFVGDPELRSLTDHGTHVAGTIAANGYLKGVAPDAKIHDYRIFNGNNQTAPNVLENAIVKAVNDGCDIINISAAGYQNSQLAITALNYAREKKVLVVVSSGNDSLNLGWNENRRSYPGSYKSVVSVAAVEYNVDEGRINLQSTKFSNRNSEIDVCADGYNVISTIKNGDYGQKIGTSMACPHVSGFAALLKQKGKLITESTGYSLCDLYTMVKLSTIPIEVEFLGVNDNIIDNITGAGLVSALPEIPSIDSNGLYYLPNLDLNSPDRKSVV